MTDNERIVFTLVQLQKIWQQNPKKTLGEFIYDVALDYDLLTITDEELVKKLQSLYPNPLPEPEQETFTMEQLLQAVDNKPALGWITPPTVPDKPDFFDTRPNVPTHESNHPQPEWHPDDKDLTTTDYMPYGGSPCCN